MEDVLIIGSGIVGSFLAYDLSHYQAKVTVLEREHDVANEVTMANSAIIHAGYDPEEGTLKAKLNVLGAQMYPSICKELHADYNKIGSFVVAHDEEEMEILSQLKQRCEERKVACEQISQERLFELEPNLSKGSIQALWVPDTAIIYPWQVAIHLMESALENGVQLQVDSEVDRIEEISGGYRVYAKDRYWDSKVVINAAGLGAEKVANLLQEQPFTLSYKRGQYYVLSKQANTFMQHIIYPIPTKKGKGVLVVPTTHGNILLGPSAELINDEDLATTSEGLQYVKEQLSNIVQNVPLKEIIRTYSGIRPCGNDGDFYIKESTTHKDFYHVACIDSPGLASAPAISNYVLEMIESSIPLQKKATYKQYLAMTHLKDVSEADKQSLIRQEPRYGHIICRCENISEQEIIDAIHRPCGATSIKGVKKRVRPGMGKCQGGFCEVEVAKILARELNIPLGDVLYDSLDSKLGEEVK